MKNKEIKVGLFAVITLTLLYFGFQYLKGINFFSSVNHFYVKYDNIDKLAVSNPVFVNGYAVGRVSDITILQHQNKVLVELEINSELQIGDSTRAILSSDFLGGKSVLLKIKMYKRWLSKDDTLHAEVEKGMMDLFSETAEPVASNIQTTMQKFSSLAEHLNQATIQTNQILKNLQATPHLVNQTLENTNKSIVDLTAKLNHTMTQFDETMKATKPILANVTSMTDSLKQLKVNQTFKHLTESIKGVQAVLQQLQKKNNTAGRLLQDDELYVNLNRLLKRLDTLTEHFNSNPRHFMSPLGKSRKKILRDQAKQKK